MLKSRGLDVGSDADAGAFLTQFGYYRLSGYWHHLRATSWDADQSQIVVHDCFSEDASLSQVIALAEFDRRLRSLFLQAIERIEIAMRVSVALLFGPRGPMAHRDPQLFYPKFTNFDPAIGDTTFGAWIKRVDGHEARSKEKFAVHIREKYGLPLPIWVSIEVWDFGMMSTLIGGMTIADQMALSAPFGLNRVHLFPSWLRAINHVRNICAHYSRLWNRSPSDQAVPPKIGDDGLLDHLAKDKFAQVRLYAVAVIVQFLLRKIDPPFASVWADNLKTLFSDFPDIPNVPVGQSGFPSAWANEPLWN